MKTLDLSSQDLQTSILQKLDLGVKKTLEEFGINAPGGDLIKAANQLLPTNEEKGSLELKKQQLIIYKQLQSQLTKQLLNKNQGFHQKILNKREQKIANKKTILDQKLKESQQVFEQCKSKVQDLPNLDENILIRIYPYDPSSRILAKKLAIKKGGNMAEHCQIEMKNPILQGPPVSETDMHRMKFFSTDDVHQFICKQWGITNSKQYAVKLRYCPSYQAFIQHTQAQFKFIQILSQNEFFRLIDDNIFMAELSADSEIMENNTKVIQLFYEIQKYEKEDSSCSSSEEITSCEESTNSNGPRKDIVDVIINILQILTLKQGQRQLETKIQQHTGNIEDSDDFADQREIARLKKMLFETQQESENSYRPPEDSPFMENNFDFEQSMSVPYPIGSDIKNGQNSLLFLPNLPNKKELILPKVPQNTEIPKKKIPKKMEKESNTYSFCDRKLKSDKLSSIYDKTVAPIGDLIQNQQTMNILQSMENIIQSNKMPTKNIDSQNSAFHLFDKAKASINQPISSAEKEQNFTSFTQYFDNQRVDENNSNSLLNFYNNKGTSLMGIPRGTLEQNTPQKKYGMSPNYNSLLDVPNTPERRKVEVSNQPSLMNIQEYESDDFESQMDPLGAAIKKIKMRYYNKQKQISEQKKQKNKPKQPQIEPKIQQQLFKEPEEPEVIPHPSKIFDMRAISQKQKAKEESQKQMHMYQINYQPYYYQKFN